ncbi:MAG: choice-of-anchor A family protein, partial [Actinomycetota bacterium]
SKTFTGDGSSALQVFNMSGDIGTATGNGGITFSNIPAGATVIVNVTGAGTKNLKTWAGGFGGLAGVDRERLLWNVTEATDVQMTGVAQWAGSVLVANPASTVVNSYPGLNGRFYALGDVTHTGNGTEFHNYPFIGDVAACDGPPPAPTFDLALQKVVASTTGSPLLASPNGSITFDITVTNQDSPVQTVDVTDYLGVGADTDFVYDDADQSTAALTVAGGDGGTFSIAWDGTDPVATLTATAGQLDDGESVTFPITLDISPSFDAATDGTFDNAAEISRFDDDTDPANGDSSQAGTGTQLVDTDSTPDATDESNDGETVGSTLVDDEIGQDGSAGADEDDHDIASLPWYDVALIIERNAATSYVLDQSGPTTSASFDITVKNQGQNEVRNVDVAHDAPVGMTFTSFDGVTAGTAIVTGTGGSYTVDALAPGEEVTFSVTFTLADGGTAGSYEVTSEVTEFEDAAGASSNDPGGPVDVDSIANTDLDDDTFFEDAGDPDNPRNSHNEIDYDSGADGVNNFDGDDEDEHDREVVVVGDRFDLALEKRIVTPVQPIVPSSTSEWEIIVTNQGDPVQFLRITDYPRYDDATNFQATISAVNEVTVSDGAVWTLDDALITTNGTPSFALTAPDAATFLDNGETITVEVVTTVGAGWDGSPLVNWAEIARFDDDTDPSNGWSASPGTGTQLVDIDSTPDFIAGNDNQPAEPGDPTDGEIGQDGKNGAPGADDEDDHDVAAVPIYDLSLINTRSAGQPFELSGDDLTIDFDVTVKNQGEEPAFLIDVRNHLPVGTSYVSFGSVTPSDDAAVTATAGTATTQDFQIDELSPGESVTWTVTVLVTDSSLAEFVNAAEIAAFDDDADAGNGVGPFAVDIDSTPGTGNSDVIDESAGIDADDVRNSHNDIDNDRTSVGPDGTGEHVFRSDLANDDEDDHDRELVVLPFDLALRKTLLTPVTSVSDGDPIDFVVTVFNQGRDVDTVDLADYLGPNFVYVAADNATTATAVTSAGGAPLTYSWDAGDIAAGGTVGGSVSGALAAGDSVDVPITLTVDIGGPDEQLDNYAEISRFDDDGDPSNGDSSAPGTGVQLVDVDSTPDATDGSNDGEDLTVDMVDNAIDGDRKDDPTADEDDHDIASTRWFDLSLIKRRSPGQPFLLDPTTGAIMASFDVTVTNQGPNPNFDTEVIDYVPAGLAFDALGAVAPGTVGVTVGAGTATTQLFTIDQLDPGEAVTFTATYEIAVGPTTPGRFVNEAEIASMEGDFDIDADGDFERVPVSDIDSTPNSTQGDDAFDPGDPTDPTDAANGVLDPDDGHNDPDVDGEGDGVNDFDGDDEDDADTEAFVMPVDLALRKTFDAFTTSPPLPDGDARFVIEVFNQGLVPVQTVEVTDYVQPGFTFDPAENPAGSAGPSTGGDWT